MIARAWLRRGLVVAGVLALLGGLVLVVPPSALGPLATVRATVAAVASEAGTTTLAWGAALAAAGFAVALLYRARSRPAAAAFDFAARDRRRAMTTPDTDPGVGVGGAADPRGAEPTTVAGEFRSSLRRATVGMDDPATDGTAVRERLHDAAVESVRRAPGEPSERAAAARVVDRGDWTDDRVAAAFLADGDGPAQPLAARLRGWLRADSAFERRVRRTTAALRRPPGPAADGEDTTADRSDGGGDAADVAVGEADDRLGGVSRDGADPEAGRVRRVRLDRWSGGLAAAAALAAGGVLTATPVLVASAAVPVVVATFGTLSRVAFDPADLAVERTLDRDGVALPGDRVDVRVRVRNGGERTLTDLRLADAVPTALPVVAGESRAAVALAPGETVTLSYTVLARRGVHEFGPLGVSARGLGGGEAVTATVAPDGAGRLDCRPAVEDVPLARRTLQFVGGGTATGGGDGVEFHATREYRRGDPVTRVDWRRLARTGELTTVDYRERAAARLVVLVDARSPARRAPVADAPTGATVAAAAGRRVLDAVADDGHLVGAAAVGLAGDAPGQPAFVPPDTDDETRLRATVLLRAAGTPPAERDGDGAWRPTAAPADAAETARPHADGGRPLEAGRGATSGDREGGVTAPADPETVAARLRERFAAATQVLFLTPALDDGAVATVRALRAGDVPVTVVSPDVTGDDTPGERLAAVERTHRLEDCRATGARVLDWDRERSLSVALALATDPGRPDDA